MLNLQDFPAIQVGRVRSGQAVEFKNADVLLDDRLRQSMALSKRPAKAHQPLRQLQDRQLRVVELLALGLRDSEIKEETGYGLASIARIKNDPLTKRHLEELRGARTAEVADISDEIQKKAPEALELLYKVMAGIHEDPAFESMRPETRVKIADKWLDRAGHTAIQKTASVNLSGQLNNNDIDELKKRARESGLLTGGSNG